MSDLTLQTRNLTKIYPGGGGAKNVNLELKRGEIIGFIGPNGAGKSTTMELIMGLTKPDAGEIELFGELINSTRKRQEAHAKIGFLQAESGLYEDYSARRLLNYSASLFGIDAQARIEKLAEKLKLPLAKKVSKLSLGNKRKVGVLQAIIPHPQLVIFDEPTSGLDPLIQQEILKILIEIKNSGGSVLISSHVLSEVESVCDRLVMIKDAEIIFSGTTKEILAQSVREIKIVSPPKELTKKIKTSKEIGGLKETDSEIIVYAKDILPIIKILTDANHSNFYLEKPNLETRFIDLY